MILPLLAYMAVLTLAVLRRDGGQVKTAGLLFGNWAVNTAFVSASGCVFPWTFFLTADWLTALGIWVVLWTTRDTHHSHRWLRLLIASYAVELLAHAAYGIAAGDDVVWSTTDAATYWQQWWYWRSLSVIAWAQITLTGFWIAYDAVLHWSRARRFVSPAAARDRETAR